jgi:hypothetical protein
MLHRLVHTVCDMLFQNGFAHLIERGANGRNLCQHVIAFAAFFPQPLQTVGMTGDACEPFGDVLARWIVCQMRHRGYNFPESNLPSPLGGYLASISTIHSALAKSQGKVGWNFLHIKSKVSIDIPSLLKKSYDVFESINILIAMTLVTRYASTVL